MKNDRVHHEKPGDACEPNEGMPRFDTYRLVKSEDLNHHGTLFAGRSAEWLVESAFVAAAHLVNPENIVCVNIHGMHFSRPVERGDVIRYSSRLVLAGRTSLVAHTTLSLQEVEAPVVEGFISFVNVDRKGRPVPHGVEVAAVTEEDRVLQERARALPRQSS